MASALERYRRRGHREVEGWLHEDAVELTCELAGLQRRRAIAGPVCEIGVHHGRLFILLHLLTTSDERALAIDLFEAQHENVDGSGEGDRARLLENLRRHGADLSRVEILAANSLRLEPRQIVEHCGGRPRLFSIDGGHTAELTCNDLRLAEATLCTGGLAIVDDYFNQAWPAVSEGTCRYMARPDAALRPVGIGTNKFFLTNDASAADDYRRALQRAHPRSKRSRVFGEDVVCIEPSRRVDRLRETAMWRALRETQLANWLRGRMHGTR